MLNSLYCNILIKKHEQVGAGIFLDQGLTKIPINIINWLWSQFIAHASTICTGDATLLTQVLSQVPLSSARKNGGH